ncbi:MAG: DUF3800 domain-containing protein [Planctomycetota bacterium]|nr:MAG: DUF3800 domain-containing protein [Planctomycetota bacterium]
MYVDDSGDTGLISNGSPTRHYCLTGLVIHELRWADTMRELLSFRHWLKRKYKVYLDDELHASEMLSKPGHCPQSLARLRKHERAAILRHHADQLARLPDIRLINVCVDKASGKDQDSHSVFRRAWFALFQRFENTILHRNFPGSPNEHERGLVFPDGMDCARLKAHLDDMRVRNPLFVRQRDGSRVSIDEPIRLLIEDPVCRDSRHSYFIQAADCAAYLFKQFLEPNGYAQKHGIQAYFPKRLKHVLCTHACNADPLGVVRL